MTRIRGLLFDIGEVVSAAPWPNLDELERVTGRSFPHRGPFDPGNDPIWRRYLDGELSYTGYWIEVATAAGYDDWKQFYRDVGALPVERFADSDAVDLIADAHAAGLTIGALTNEGAAINGMGFFERVPVFEHFTAIVDAAEFGSRKPDPQTYLRAADAMKLAPDEIVFLDDTPLCVWGAEAVGMTGVLVDPVVRRPAFDLVRDIVGIAPASDARRLVADAEAAWRSNDLDRIMTLFDPDAIVVRNGELVATGTVEIRRFVGELLELERDRPECSPTIRLRAATGDTITVESRACCVSANDARVEPAAVEIWTLRRGKLVAWHHHGAGR